MSWSRFVGFAVAVLLPACGFVKVTTPGRYQAGSGRYSGKQCKKSSWKTDTPEDSVLLRICDRSFLYGAPVDAAIAVEKRHKKFDDRHPDMLAAAYNVIDCSRECGSFPLAMGVSSYYAGILDRGALAKQLASVQLPDDAKTAFVDAAMSAKQKVIAAADKLDPRRHHMYVETVSGVVQKRNAYFQAHSDLYDRLDAIEAQAKNARLESKAPADLVQGLRKLRADYFATCKSDECRFDPFVIETTRQLVLLYIAAGDELGARAENGLLAEKAAGRHLFSVETGTAVYKAMQEERHSWELYTRAKRAGLDPETLKARFGDPPPIQVDPSSDYVGSNRLPDLTRALDTGEGKSSIQMEGGIVAAVTATLRSFRGQKLSRVAFRPNVSNEDIESCYETGHVTGVHFDGNHASLEYETVCNVVGRRTHVDRVQPVFVPKVEVAHVRPGENLEALVDGKHEGLVVRSLARHTRKSKAPTRLLQIRGVRMPGS